MLKLYQVKKKFHCLKMTIAFPWVAHLFIYSHYNILLVLFNLFNEVKYFASNKPHPFHLNLVIHVVVANHVKAFDKVIVMILLNCWIKYFWKEIQLKAQVNVYKISLTNYPSEVVEFWILDDWAIQRMRHSQNDIF